LPPDGSGRVRTAEQRPWAELKNDLNQTLSAQRARRAVAFSRARLGISETVSATKSLGLAARVGKMGRGSADSPKPERSGGGINLTREHPWASASLGGLRGATRKATKSCATGQIQRSREGTPFRAGLGRREAQISDSRQWHFLTRNNEFSSLDEWRTRLLQIHTKNFCQHWREGCPVASSSSLKCWSRYHKARL